MNMPISLSSSRPQSAGQRGLTLVELMIAMLLGLIILGAVVSVFLANRVSYNAGENLGRVQENARLAFDLMARDIREAGGSGCGENLTEVNVIGAVPWWMNFGASSLGITGFAEGQLYDGVGAAARADGSEALHMSYAGGQGSVVTAHDIPGRTLTLAANVDAVSENDIALVCDFARYSIFQVTSAVGADIGHDEEALNSTSDIGTYAVNAALYRYNSVGWYVGCNGSGVPCDQPGGRSLYRVSLRAGAPQADEMIEGVQRMELSFLVRGTTQYVQPDPANPAAIDWRLVTAVRITLEFVGPDAGVTTGAAADRLTRRVTQTVAIRNRVS